MTSPTAPDGAKKVKGNRKLLVGVGLSLGVVLGLVLFNHRGIYQIYRFHHDRQHLDQENARLTAENERLARTIDRLQHDPEFIQEYIRRELNFVKRNEIIFQLPPDGPAPTAAAPTPSKAEPVPGNRPPLPAAKAHSSKVSWDSLEGAPPKAPGQRRE